MNILSPMYNKQRISFKEAVDSFQSSKHWDFTISNGYCESQFFLSTLEKLSGVRLSPFAYSASKSYGWRCDYYNIPRHIALQKNDTPFISQDYFILVTGYATPSKLKKPDYNKVIELEKLAETIASEVRKKNNPTIEMKQLYINELLLGFASLVADAHRK